MQAWSRNSMTRRMEQLHTPEQAQRPDQRLVFTQKETKQNQNKTHKKNKKKNQKGTGEGDEAEGVHAGLHHLPEVHVLMVEDVAVWVDVVHELRAQRAANVVARVDVAQHDLRNKHKVKHAFRSAEAWCAAQKARETSSHDD